MSALTQRKSGRAVVIAVAVLMIAALAFFGPPSQAEVTIEADAGVILLSTGPNAADNWIRYYADTDAFDIDDPTATQVINVDRCLATFSGDDILAISQSGGSKGLGLVNNGFGTRDKNNCATGNGQIAIGESVTIGLGSYFDDSHGFDAVEVDIEGKQNANLEYTPAGSPPSPIILDSASDNGPDSGTNDNDIIELAFASPVSAISFAPHGNSKALISVEGGGDGSIGGTAGSMRETLGVNQSLFALTSTEVFDGQIACDGTAGAIDTSDDGGPALSGDLVRGSDLKGECENLVPYTFHIEGDNVFFDFNDDFVDGPTFLVKIVWDPTHTTVDPVNPPVRQVDVGTGVFTDGVACDSVDPLGTPVQNPPVVGSGYSHSTSPVCLASQTFDLTPDGWQQTQWWAVNGDPRWK